MHLSAMGSSVDTHMLDVGTPYLLHNWKHDCRSMYDGNQGFIIMID